MLEQFFSIHIAWVLLHLPSILALNYPECIIHNRRPLLNEGSLQINVANFFDFGARAENCDSVLCSDSDHFGVENISSCASVCSKNSDCRTWIYGSDQGYNTCWLFSSKSTLNDVPEAEGFSFASVECSPSIWPGCLEEGVVIKNAGKAAWFDATAFGSNPVDGCYQSDCTFTDKFIVKNSAQCGTACAQLPECEFWSFGKEDELTKCWLRIADDGRQAAEGFVSGSKLCGVYAPEQKSRWTQGENNCWSAGFTEAMCCGEQYGPRGNTACWDAAHTFEMCCLGETPSWSVGDSNREL